MRALMLDPPKILVLLPIAVLLPMSTASAATIRVPGDQATMQAGIDAASAGDTVLVAPGSYSGAGNRDLDLRGKAVVVRSQAGSALTVLDCGGSPATPHRGFYIHAAETASTVVEGFTVKNGFAAGAWPASLGGGAYVESASPTFMDCVFDNNTAAAEGGGVHCRYDSSPRFVRCTFRANHADGGGGFAGVLNESPMLDECVFVDNSAVTGGGGALFASTALPVIQRCEFRGNSSPGREGGGVLFRVCEAPAMEDCLLVENAAGYGGGVYFQGRAPAGARPGEEGRSRVGTRETRHAGNEGPPPTTFLGCGFRGNTAEAGGGMWLAEDDVPVVLWATTFAENSAAGDGGAIYCTRVPLEMSSCTFASNAGARGGALFLADLPVPASVGKSVIAFGTAGGAVWCDAGGSASFYCGDVFGNVGGDWTGCIAGEYGVHGNFSADPLFCDLAAGDLRLSSESPCVIPQLDRMCGESIGAWGVACGTAGVAEGRMIPSTWGLVKHLFNMPGR